MDHTGTLTDLLMVFDTLEFPSRPHPSLNWHVSVLAARVVLPLSVAFLARWVTCHLQDWHMIARGVLPMRNPPPPRSPGGHPRSRTWSAPSSETPPWHISCVLTQTLSWCSPPLPKFTLYISEFHDPWTLWQFGTMCCCGTIRSSTLCLGKGTSVSEYALVFAGCVRGRVLQGHRLR